MASPMLSSHVPKFPWSFFSESVCILHRNYQVYKNYYNTLFFQASKPSLKGFFVKMALLKRLKSEAQNSGESADNVRSYAYHRRKCRGWVQGKASCSAARALERKVFYSLQSCTKLVHEAVTGFTWGCPMGSWSAYLIGPYSHKHLVLGDFVLKKQQK